MKQFRLKKPCKDCPFTTNVSRSWLGSERVKGITDKLGSSVFHCHKTYGDNPAICAGAILLNEKEYKRGEPLMPVLKFSERLGYYKRSEYSGDTVFDSYEDMRKYHKIK